MMTKQILLALTAGDSPALGNIWRITAKKTDFYLDALDDLGHATAGHLSIHGPNQRFGSHRFHIIKVDRDLAANARQRSYFVEHGIPRAGFAFDGVQVAPRAFRVARIRWTWHLQRERFRSAALAGNPPELTDDQSGKRLGDLLAPNDAWDIDFVVAYDEPYWLNPRGSLRDNARIGPLRNDAGHWLTATSFRRSQTSYPTPDALAPRLPRLGEQPNKITCGGPGDEAAGGSYWFVETITSRELIGATSAAQNR